MPLSNANHPPLTIRTAFMQGSALLQAQSSPSAALDTECLLMHVLQMRKEQLYLHFEETLSCAQQVQLQLLLQQRQRGAPIAYLVGTKEFYGRSFYVDSRVFIPRPETEALVVQAKKNLPDDARLLDIGTGSGCLAITMALERKHSLVTAWDVDSDALSVARHNAAQLNCTNIIFEQRDIFAPVPSTHYDGIVANPPYILPQEKGSLPVAVRAYEPHQALFTDRHGLRHYQRIAALAAQLLPPEGLLCLELNPTTARATTALCLQYGFKIITANSHTLTLRRSNVKSLV